MILGAINILICSGIYFTLPSNLNGHQAHHSKNHASYQGIRWALQQPMFWLLLITLTLFTSVTSAFIFHLYPMLLERGITTSQVISIIAVIGPSQVAGRLMLMLFSSHLNTSRLAIFISMMMSGVLAGFLFLPSAFWLMASLAALLGACIGVMTIIKGIAVPEFLTEQAYGAINGVMNVPIKIVSALAPAIAALLWSVNNNYDLVLLILVGLGVVISALFVFIYQLKNSNSRTG